MSETAAGAPICQSCAMPMAEPAQCGTCADGSPSAEYCCYCYQGGQFTAELTLEQMTEKLVGFAGQIGMTEAQVRELAAQVLPTLKRWQA